MPQAALQQQAPFPQVPFPGAAIQAPPQGPPPHAARRTTVILVVVLIVVLAISVVLGAIAVLSTQNPDAPPLSGTPVLKLRSPVHFAPVTGVHAAPCDGMEAVPDNTGTTCYQLDPGVTVTTVQKVGSVAESDGTYSIRLVLSPASRQQIADLTRETVRQQLAIVVGDQVVAAPRVAQAITQDSLSIAGFDKTQADALMALLSGPSSGQSPAGTSPTPGQPGQPGQTGQAGQPSQPGLPGQTTPGTPFPGQTGSFTSPGTTTFTTPPATPQGFSTQPASGSTSGSVRYADCRQANDNGYGPYTKGVHPEYYWYVDADNDGVACDPGDLG
ncbi:excalibur calcium-binding domain-containing protein [Planotetraspora kaengkrachanensis]|uniref:excalibur calcium-binding domain-containing protein n=1 Tax=Planotetraspora kaengkrachanensis TaxID=575193 RepID=UPI0019456A22|nr:excalibur calcium-binding domain-containing protein [Planotetraspora kaengkrachanensis]